MCGHSYKDDKLRRCPFPEIYKWARAKLDKRVRLAGSALTLPLDDKGECVFHSSDRNFKVENDLRTRFRDLLKILNEHLKLKKPLVELLDFDEFRFVAQDSPAPYIGSPVTDLSDIKFHSAVSFRGAHFEDDTWFTNSEFRGSVMFNDATFATTVNFESAQFQRRSAFIKTRFVMGSSFRDVKFNAPADFDSANFTGDTVFNLTEFLSGARFDGAVLAGDTVFQECNFHQKSHLDHLTSFHGADFGTHLRIENCAFDGEVTFLNARFKGAQIIDTTFSQNRRVIFDRIRVSGEVLFKSLDPKNKLFTHLVSMDLRPEEISGRLVFENANLFFIQQNEMLTRLSHPDFNKVIFGNGCDRYRLRWELGIPIKQEWQFLIEEVAETFVLFFNFRGAADVKVHLECDYHEDKVVIRYYADSDMDISRFKKLLREQIPAFTSLLKEPESILGSLDLGPDDLIPAYDLYRKTKSAQLGVAPRIVYDPNWDEATTAKMLKAIGWSGRGPLFLEIHQHFKQIDILSFKSTKQIAGRDLTTNAGGGDIRP